MPGPTLSRWTIARCLQRAAELDAVSDTARLDLEVLLARVIGKSRTWLYTWPEKTLTEQQARCFARWFERRKQGEPVAHIVGEREFWSLPLAVNASTLIPRPETELLVATALELLPATEQTILDLGTGTGAIALALASERPDWQILAVDQSPEAVQLAIENCRQLGFTNVTINRSNWYENVEQRQFSAIVCNPPYVDPQDHHLQQGDVQFEPLSALVAEEHGLADLATVIGGARTRLKRGGWLLVEHGRDQGSDVRGLFQKHHFVAIDTRHDLAGQERITVGQYSGDVS